jgi:hypothetical protein
MGTTLPWQRSPAPTLSKKPKRELARLESKRREGYAAWHTAEGKTVIRLSLLRDGVEVPNKTGRPRKGEEMGAERTSEITAFGIQARAAHGYNEALRLMQDHFLIKRSRAKRILDAEIAKNGNEPMSGRFLY